MTNFWELRLALHMVRVIHIIHVIVSLNFLHVGGAGAKGQNARPGEYSSTSADDGPKLRLEWEGMDEKSPKAAMIKLTEGIKKPLRNGERALWSDGFTRSMILGQRNEQDTDRSDEAGE